MAKFKDYPLIGDVDLEKLEGLHNLAVKYKGDIFTDNDVQDILLTDGYNPEGERRTSFHDVYDMTFLRTRTSVHLGFLEKMIEMATVPQLAVVRGEEEGIVSPEGKGVLYPNDVAVKAKLETPGGHNYVMTEELQEGWFREPEVAEDVRSFQKHLNGAFEEFNLKFILGRMYNSLKLFVPEDFGRVYKIHHKIMDAFGGKYEDRGLEFVALDNAYYNMAKRFFNRVAGSWNKLNESNFGKRFILSPEEDRKAMEDVMRRGAC